MGRHLGLRGPETEPIIALQLANVSISVSAAGLMCFHF